jgi:hypothetical protein
VNSSKQTPDHDPIFKPFPLLKFVVRTFHEAYLSKRVRQRRITYSKKLPLLSSILRRWPIDHGQLYRKSLLSELNIREGSFHVKRKAATFTRLEIIPPLEFLTGFAEESSVHYW